MFSSFTILDVLIFITGTQWLLKKIAEMDRYDDLRIIVLTVILSCVALYGFRYVWLEAGNAEYFEDDCRVEQRFCHWELSSFNLQSNSKTFHRIFEPAEPTV